MKKIITTVFLFLAIVGNGKAQKNLFDATDVDADGWIWFDTQAKIDKYIGQSNNEEAKYSETGKIIQMVSAGFGEYVDSEASVSLVGAGTDGVLAGPGAHTGVIKLASASASMATDGGGFIVKMPSCTSFNICLSADSKMLVRLSGATQSGTITSDYKVVCAKYASILKFLSSAGIYKWTGLEVLDSGFDPIFKLASSTTVYAYFQNFTKNNLYIHGLRVLTAQSASGLNDALGESQNVLFDGKNILLFEKATIKVFNAQGALIREAIDSTLPVDDMNKGVYIAQVTFAGKKSITKKIIIR